MRRALFVPLPEPGHILPTVRIAEYLASHGWDVLYFTAPQFRDLVEQIPAMLIPMIPDDLGEKECSAQHIWARFVFDTEQGSKARHLRKVLGPIVVQWDCSLLLIDARLSNHADSNLNGITQGRPWLLFSTVFPDWREYDGLKLDVPMMILCPEQLEIPKFRHPCSGLHYVEPSIWPSDEESAPPRDLTRPLVLITFGTQSVRDARILHEFALVKELAARRREIDFLMATRGLDETLGWTPSDIPQNLQLSRRVAQRSVLRRATAFITHGGLGGVKEAIVAGVPMIVLPALFDQPLNAMRVRYHGLGEAIFPERQSVDSLEGALINIAEGRYDRKVRSMQQVFLEAEEQRPSEQVLAPFLTVGLPSI